ncbi:MAG: hypothetical protein KF773_33680 [Deltaproteobacteria bacterium]|nr:hypothetical protein [Deltaproteobacteria bacterium]
MTTLRVLVILLAARTAARAEDRHDVHDEHAGHAGHAGPTEHGEHDVPSLPDASGHHHHQHRGAMLSASVGVMLADYEARLYRGDYQGLVTGARWTHGRYGLGASLTSYRLTKNGKTIDGIGDVMAHAHASLVERGPWNLGVMLMASAPTGDDLAGLGMGHVMFMPELWAGWTRGRLAAAASAGYSYMLGGVLAHAEHGGGMWPLVDPMNASELTYAGGLTLGLARDLGLGARLRGAAPLGDGTHRLYGALRIIWVAGRAETTLEIQRGALGDPFGLRGILETAIRIR